MILVHILSIYGAYLHGQEFPITVDKRSPCFTIDTNHQTIPQVVVISLVVAAH